MNNEENEVNYDDDYLRKGQEAILEERKLFQLRMEILREIREAFEERSRKREQLMSHNNIL